MKRIFAIAALLLLSSQTFAWSMTGDFRFQGGAKAVTTAVSPANDPITINAAIAQAKVVEESIVVSDKSEPCQRLSGQELSCIATALDDTLSDGCTYCGSGEAEMYKDTPNGEFVDGDTWSDPCVIYRRPGGR